MTIQAKPSPLNETLRADEALENRAFSCPLYDSCLWYACQSKWNSFTCKNCSNFSKERELRSKGGIL